MEREELYFQPEIECAEPEVLREIQSERLRSMVARCYHHVPFIAANWMRWGFGRKTFKVLMIS